MDSTLKKKQSNRRLLKQLDDFDQDVLFGNAASQRQENITVKEGTNDRDITVGTSSSNAVINENAVNVKVLERCFIEGIDREMNDSADTVEDRIQNAILTAVNNIAAHKIEVAIRSINTSSEQDATSVIANSESGEHVGINVSLQNVSGDNIVQHVSYGNDETRNNIPDDVSELLVPKTRFDRKTHTHHLVTGQTTQTNQIPEFLTGRILTPRNPTSHQHQNLLTQVSQENNFPMVEQTHHIKTPTQTIPLTVLVMQLQEFQPNNDHKQLQY